MSADLHPPSTNDHNKTKKTMIMIRFVVTNVRQQTTQRQSLLLPPPQQLSCQLSSRQRLPLQSTSTTRNSSCQYRSITTTTGTTSCIACSCSSAAEATITRTVAYKQRNSVVFGRTSSFSSLPPSWSTTTSRQMSSSNNNNTTTKMTTSSTTAVENGDDTDKVYPAHFHSGPSLELGLGRLGLHTYASVVATAGSTTILCTVAREPLLPDNNSTSSNNGDNGGESFLTVEFRQRSAAVGQIPGNRLRNDQGRMMSSSEVLASRIIDRSLRPLLVKNTPQDDLAVTTGQPPVSAAAAAAHYHVLAAVQSIDLWASTRTGHPIATALNAASAALASQLIEPVAATVLAVMSDGSILQDPGPATRQPIQMKQPPPIQQPPDSPDFVATPARIVEDDQRIQIEPYCVGELLYAGTRTHAIMMEWTSIHDSLAEDQWPALLALASASIQPIIDTIEELQLLQQEKHEQIQMVDKPDGYVSPEDATTLTAQLRASLGLPPLDDDSDATNGKTDLSNDDSDDSVRVMNREQIPDESDATNTDLSNDDGDDSVRVLNRKQLLNAALPYCREQLGETPMHSLYGVRSTGKPARKDESFDPVATHRKPEEILSKRHRGRRETIMNQEIYRLVDEYIVKQAGYKLYKEEDGSDDGSYIIPTSDRKWLQQTVAYILLKHGLWETSFRFGTRSDGRRNTHVGQGWKTIRPIQMTVPALPDSVHGSAIFARGDTQVLCTVTLGAPREGQPLSDPYQPTTNPQLAASEAESPTTPSLDGEEVSFDKLPIGSLRFLRTQEALESDLNSRKSLADKERTGDSGNLSEVKRAFLQYDFPPYSTGSVPKRGGMDRRSVGHGALAERAVLPVMPEAHVFPYAVRITSEVTDSNGSSSMASVCGATLALRDAGVPLKASVAGVSVGLALPAKEVMDIFNIDDKSADVEKNYSLLLDITGTEDHYGAMDFKIAGTRKGVTAIQLDVKEPLPISVLVEALHLAKAGRVAIIDKMDQMCAESFGSELGRPEPKPLAPRVEVVRFDPQRKRDLVGPGGVVLRQLEDRYGVALDLTQEGQCLLFGANRDMVANAKQTVMDLVAEVVEGQTYVGTVIEIKDFGAIIELLRNKEGILHVSEISTDPDEARLHPEGNMGFVRQQLRLGQKIELLCIGVDPVQGSVKLSRKALLEKKNHVQTEFTTMP